MITQNPGSIDLSTKAEGTQAYVIPTSDVPTPDFLWSFVASKHFMRLSLRKGAHADLSRTAYRKSGFGTLSSRS
jgi:hypothetical protein